MLIFDCFSPQLFNFHLSIIGGALCQQLDDITDPQTELRCQLGIGSGLTPGATYSVEVLVKNFGYALHQHAFNIKFLSKVSTIIPVVS